MTSRLSSNVVNNTSADTTLLQGLDPVLSPKEQAMLTSMLTSGDADKLAAAAKIMYDIDLLLEDICVHHDRSGKHAELIQNSFKYHAGHHWKEDKAHGKVHASYNDYEERVYMEHLEYEREMEAHKHDLPLPVRMPHFVTIDAFDPYGTKPSKESSSGFETITDYLGWTGDAGKPSLTFVGDQCDGHLSRAFTRLKVVRDSNAPDGYAVEKNTIDSPGFHEIAKLADGDYDSEVPNADKLKVLIGKCRNDAAKVGLHAGDVITHVNGKHFVGTVYELKQIIKKHYDDVRDEDGDDKSKKLEIVVNAAPCIAQALKLRHLARTPPAKQ